MSITQTITSLPAGPNAATDDDNAFQSKAETRVAAEGAMVTELNTAFGQINATEASMNAIAAGGISIPYTFSTTTADADPGNGVLRLDNATQNLAGTIRADLLGSNGSDFTALLDVFDASTSTIKGLVRLQKASDATKFIDFSLTARAAPSGYRNLTVSVVASSGATPFANNDPLLLKFTRNGDKGDTGSTGATGAAGASGGVVLLASLTPTAAANVDFLSTFTSGYDSYLIIGEGLLPASTDTLRFRLANTGSADAGSNYIDVSAGLSSTTGTSVNSAASVVGGGKGCGFNLWVRNANDATNLKGIDLRLTYSPSASNYNYNDVKAVYVGGVVTGARFYWNGGVNFAAQGKIRVYGFSNT